MCNSLRVLAILAAGLASLSGAMPPRSRAFAIDGAIQNPANGHWYKVYHNGTLSSWNQNKANAEALGGYLLTITSAQENAWVTSNVIPGINTASLGAWEPSGTAVLQNFQWSNGETWSYTNWDSGWNPVGSISVVLGGLHAKNGSWRAIASPSGVGNSADYYVVEWTDSIPPVPPTPPAAPSNLTASVSTGNPIELLWLDNSDNEETFELERRTATTAYSRVAELGPNSAGSEDVSTVPGTEYTYRVRAKNSGYISDWSNEASVTASAIAPGPNAPADLTVVARTADSVELQWIDASVDEIGFEIHRRRPGGDYVLVQSLPPGSSGFTDTGLSPDTEWEYGVRSLNAFRASGFCVAAAATLPTLSVTATRADLKDSPKFGKDSLKVQATFDFLPESPDGLFDVLAEGIMLRTGPVDRPVVMTLPKNLDTWKVKGTKATWKSPKGSTPKYCIQVDTEKRTVKATAAGLELPEPPVNPMRVSVGIGNDAGTARGDWETKKPGVFKLR
jgi:hypothetical protein